MAKISSYPILSTPTINDLLIGTDVDNLNNTKNFSIGDIASFIIGGSYVPYIGATGNVNLGTFNITSGAFIVGGGTASQFLKANGTLDSTVYQPAGNYITQLSGEATASGPGNAAVTLSNAAVIGKVLTGLTITGSVITAADTILTAFGKVQNQINTLVGGVQYKGTWNAATNTPALVSSVGVQGNYYVVSVAGNTNLNGITDWQLGDWAIFNGSAWEKVDNTDAVISVNGQVGAVVLTTTNIAEGTNLYYTDLRARGAINLTTVGNSGAATYNNTNGFFNIPEYTLSGLGGVPSTRQLTINGTAFDLSANRSWNVGTVTSVATTAPITGGTITGSGTIGITQASSTTDGYLSSTDWTTFNSKQNAITNPVTGTGTAFFLPMWSNASNLVNSPLSYLSDTFTFQYNSATGGTVNFTNSNGTAYAYTIQMNNFGSPRSTVHSYTDGIVVQSIGGVQVSRVFANGNTVFGTGVSDNGHKLELSGSLFVNTIANATIDTDRFLVSDSGVIKYRTGTELRSDIGAGVGSVTSVGLTMPSAFSVANSPITGAGTLAVTGAGNASQYVRGDGTLADFPTSTGGGSSVSYYLNGSVSQGTIGGVAYRELSEVPVFGAGTDISIAADGYIASFITDAGDPALLNIPAGNWNFETYFSASSGGGTPSFYVELYRYDGTTFTLIASSSSVPELISFGTNIQPYFSTLAVPQTALAVTDRLAIRYYVNVSGRTITIHTEDNHLCQVVTTFSNGLTALNGLTDQVQFFQVGTSGTDFNISSVSPTHTFNLPDASASARGLVTTGSQVFGGSKTFTNGVSFVSAGGTNQVTRIVNIGTLHEGSATLNQIGFNSGNNIYFGKGLNNGGVIQWTNAAVRYYTFPDADGTIALTSNLGAYLPLTGGTLTGGLNGTTATFSGDIQSNTRLASSNGGQSILITANSGGTTNRIEGSTGLPLHIVTSGSSLALAAGGTTPQITLASDGNVTFTGGLNAATASFTGNLASSTSVFAGQAFRSLYSVGTSTIIGYNSIQGDVNGFIVANTIKGFRINFPSNNSFTHTLPDASGTLALTSNLSAYLPLTGGTLTGALNGTTASFDSTGTYVLSLNNTAQDTRMQLQVNGTQTFQLSSSSSQVNILGATNIPMIFYTNATERFRIANSGAATFSSSVTTGGRVHLIANNNTASVRLQNNAANKVWELNPSNPDVSNSGFTIWNVTDNTKPFHITDGGNVGIGTASPYGKVEITGLANNYNTAPAITLTDLAGDANSNRWIVGNIATDYGSFNIASAPTPSSTTWTPRITINRSGNVGIGTSSPNIYNLTNTANLTLSTTTANYAVITAAGSAGNGGEIDFGNQTIRHAAIASLNGSNLGFYTNGSNSGTGVTERMRITSGGDLLVGITSTYTNARYQSENITGTKAAMALRAQATSGSTLVEFWNPNGQIGSIQTSGSATSFVTSSDYRLKENVKPVENALSLLTQLKPCTFNFIADADEEVMGFIAHEVQEVIPQAVTGEKDAVTIQQIEVSPTELDEEGNIITEAVIEEKEIPVYQGIDHSKLVPLLVAAIQELKTEIDSLKNQMQ